MIFYDGRRDIIAKPTLHSVSLVSAGLCSNVALNHQIRQSLTLRELGRRDWSLFYCTEGTAEFGKDKPLRVQKNECFIYPPEVYQYYFVGEEETRYYFLHFTGSCVKEIMEELKLPIGLPFCPEEHFDPAQFEKIKRLYDSGTPCQTEIEWRLLRLLTSLSGSREKNKERNIFTALLDEMENRYFEPYDGQAYAKKLGISLSRFNHLFKDTVGESPLHYYTRIRITNAARLLKYTDFPVQKVASSVGYEDPLYFDRVFRKWMQQSPRAYRREQE